MGEIIYCRKCFLDFATSKYVSTPRSVRLTAKRIRLSIICMESFGNKIKIKAMPTK